MSRFRPIHGILLVLVVGALVMFAEFAYRGGFSAADFEPVAPDTSGQVRIQLTGLGQNQVRFFRFVNTGNQEVRFLVGRDKSNTIQVAFDANELCAKFPTSGYRHEGEWLVCNKCDKSFHLDKANDGGGGCNPVPLKHRVDGETLVLAENDILEGWRLFR